MATYFTSCRGDETLGHEPDDPQTEFMLRVIQYMGTQRDCATPAELEALTSQVETDPDLLHELIESVPQLRALYLVLIKGEVSSGSHRVALARRALALDPQCADAYLILAEDVYDEDLPAARDLYLQAVAAAERSLSPAYFTDPDYVGHFWDFIETRPYLRARHELAGVLWLLGERLAAVAHLRALLHLDTSDGQFMRYTLLSWLIATDQVSDAVQLYRHYSPTPDGFLAYLQAVLLYRQTGDSPATRTAFREALQANRYVPRYLLGVERMPDVPGGAVAWDGPIGGVIIAHHIGDAWLETPGAREWMAKELMARTQAPDN
jgi:tetratricopeptide (TPR) repeat protein